MRKKRTFTDEFKKEAVALVHLPGMGVTKVARDLDLTPSAMAKWVRKSQANPSSPNTKVPELLNDALRQQIQEQQKQIRLLTMECDILKKTATFFAKESE